MSLNYICYMGCIITLPFVCFPVEIPGIGHNLAQWIAMVGMIYSLYYFLHHKESVDGIEKIFIKYMLVFTAWQVLCTIIGIISFPYNDLLDATQMSAKLSWVLNHIGYQGSDLSAIKTWLTFRFIKNIFLSMLFSFGISLWGYHAYKGKKDLLIRHTIKAVQILACLCIVYSILEIGYLCGSSVCRDMLIYINPLYMDVQSAHGWWPPLLWSTQLRSLFPEPSFLGITGSLITPILLLSYLKNRSYFSLGLFFCFSILIFLTKARTATIVYILQLIFFVIGYILYSKRNLKKLFLILMCAVISFGISLPIVSNYYNWQKNTAVTQKTVSAKNYVEKNVTSVKGNERSNSARYTNVRATFETALQHPVFGTGKGLKDAYIDSNLTSKDLKVGEVKLWSNKMHENGILKSGFPILNEFSGEFVQFGVLGLVLYCFPILLISFFIVKKKRIFNSIEIICANVGLVGVLATLFSNSARISFYIVIGILMCLLWSKDNGGNVNKE